MKVRPWRELTALVALTVLAGVGTALAPETAHAPVRTLSVAVATAEPQPHGPSGAWDLVWRDEFNGDKLDTAKWTVPTTWKINNVTPSKSNVWVWGGHLGMKLSSATSGGAVLSAFKLKPGMVAEARVRFPGSDAGDHIYNFPAWWAVGVVYPDAGEHDIAEGLGDLYSNYWDRTKTRTFKRMLPGDLNNAYHVYTLKRGKTSASVYLDGEWLWNYPTNDDGGAEHLIINVGSSPKRALVVGDPSRVRVDWVRVYAPA